MAKTKFTTEQQLAIDTIDRSVLVSAAAGSGKTSVLIERIIGIILKGEADVDQMLIVTFTNAAAAEMRIKLSKALKKEMELQPQKRAKLREQLDKLYRAYITTFNSFAIRIIREFFYEVDAEPNFAVCDDVEGTMMQNEALDQLFEEAFEKDDIIPGASFRGFLRLYSSDRNEDEIKAKMLRAYGKLRTMPNYFEWARKSAEACEEQADAFEDSWLEQLLYDECKELLASVLTGIRDIKASYGKVGLDELYKSTLAVDEMYLTKVYDLLVDKEKLSKEVVTALVDFEFARMSAGKKENKEAYNSIKDEVKEQRDFYKKTFNDWITKYISPDIETRLQEMKESAKQTLYFISLLEAFEERYKALKKEQGLLDFSDMEHTADLILSKPEISAIMQDRFKYVFIDEYQDTNNIQEHLISQVSRADNVFKVGDVKQSIYRFRQAEPAIFERTYKEYSDADNDSATAIDLNMNFRSNANTVKYINAVFENIMEGYDENAKLKPCPLSAKDPFDYKPELHILEEKPLSEAYAVADADAEDGAGADTGAGAEADAGADAGAGVDADAEAGAGDTAEAGADADAGSSSSIMQEKTDEEIEEMSKQEAEAKYVAQLVQSLVGTEYYDTMLGQNRIAEPRDIVILLRSVAGRGETYAKELRNLNLQSHVVEEESLFDATEIRVVLSILSTIDNIKRDIPLIASLHSEVWGFGAEELATIRAEAGGSMPFYDALFWYMKKGSDKELACRISEAVSQIEEWRSLATMMALPDFIWKVLKDSGYYLYAGAMFDGSRRQANLRALVDKAEKYTENNIASLSDFLRYLDVMRTKKCNSNQPSMVSKEDNLVQITTIHKSKGLEYPFVIVAGLGNRLRHDDLGKGFNFDSELGVSFPYVSPDKKFWRPTIMQQLIHQKNRAEEDAEELRILYVAMTRARNKLVLVGTVNNGEAFEKKYKTPSNYLEIMSEVLKTPYNDVYIKPLEKTMPAYESSGIKSIIASKDKALSEPAENNYKEVSRRLSYKYPYANELSVKAKYSVSELRKRADEEAVGTRLGAQADTDTKNVSAVGKKSDATAEKKSGTTAEKHASTSSKASSAELGTAYHRIMEFIDFAKAGDPSYLKESAEQLRTNGAIAEEVFAKLDLSRISAFFETDIGKRAVTAGSKGLLKKEKTFTLATEVNGNRTLVQGVIDCCFEEDGEYVLVDYKSSYMSLENIKSKYEVQIEIYRNAISKGTGKPVKEAYLYSFELGKAISV